MILSGATFIQYAMKYYDNPHCQDIEEFEEDLKRFQYIRKLFNRFIRDGDLRERLLLNHITIIYNVFGIQATNMLFMKMEGQHEYLKPFIEFLNYLPEVVSYNDKTLYTVSIKSNTEITTRLEKL
jgi:hypothetical protein